MDESAVVWLTTSASRVGFDPTPESDFLIYTNDQCFIGGIQIQAHHVSQFLHELGIARQLKLAHSMGLQPVSIPDALKRRCTRTAVAPFGLLCNVASTIR
jgi:hypothetical protein